MADSKELIDVTIKAREAKTQWLLDKLQEECAEVIQAVSKIRRFGKDNYHPDRTTSNLQELENELEDLQAIVQKLEELRYLDVFPQLVQAKAAQL